MASGFKDAFRLAWGWLSRGASAPVSPVRVFVLPWSLRNTFTLPWSLRNTFTLPWSLPMSATGSAAYFAGEPVLLVYTNPLGTDMAGWTLTIELKNASGTLVLTKTPTANSPGVGSASVSIARADTLALPPGGYAYRFRRTDAGLENVLGDGFFTLE